MKSHEEAADRLVVHRNSVWNWLEAYKTGALEQILRVGKTEPKPVQKSLSVPVFGAFEKQVRGEGFSGYTHAQEWLRTRFGVDPPYSTVHKLIRYRLGAKLKRARPRHQKTKNDSDAACFPARLTRFVNAVDGFCSRPVRLFVQDGPRRLAYNNATSSGTRRASLAMVAARSTISARSASGSS